MVHVDTSFDPPTNVVGNVRFTNSGVYADFLVHGLPTILKKMPFFERAAGSHRNLGRNLPSGSMLYGLIADDDQDRLVTSMIGRHAVDSPWDAYCRQAWPQIIADPLQLGDMRGPDQRVHWLTIPVDSGKDCRTVSGKAGKLAAWAIGRDPDSDASLRAF